MGETGHAEGDPPVNAASSTKEDHQQRDEAEDRRDHMAAHGEKLREAGVDLAIQGPADEELRREEPRHTDHEHPDQRRRCMLEPELGSDPDAHDRDRERDDRTDPEEPAAEYPSDGLRRPQGGHPSRGPERATEHEREGPDDQPSELPEALKSHVG